MKDLNEIKIKSIRKKDPSEYEGEYKYSVNVNKNHNFFMNGGVLSKNCIVLVDECQNISRDNIRTILTRLGYNSKMVLLGDLKQTDLKNRKSSSLAYILDLFKDMQEIGIVRFENEDIVRNPLIIKMEEVFDNNES